MRSSSKSRAEEGEGRGIEEERLSALRESLAKDTQLDVLQQRWESSALRLNRVGDLKTKLDAGACRASATASSMPLHARFRRWSVS